MIPGVFPPPAETEEALKGQPFRLFAPGALLMDLLGRIGTFLYILIILFALQIIMKVFSLWQGVSIIVNMYLYVFSFYLIYIFFSSIDLRGLKPLYRRKYKKWGDLVLFSVARLIPFAIIYFVTAVFTMINYSGDDLWPWRPLLELLDGRFSNIVFYSLMLLVILKLKKEPKITIPLFLFLSVIYFLVYKLVFTFSPTGLAVSLLKYFQISVALFFLINEYVAQPEKIAKIIGEALVLGGVAYFTLVGIFAAFYKFSDAVTYRHIKSAMVLLKLGYDFPLREMQEEIIKINNPYPLTTVLYYSERAGLALPLSVSRWESYLAAGTPSTSDDIAGYLHRHRIRVSCEVLGSFAERESARNGEALVDAGRLIGYTAWCCGEDFEPMIRRCSGGDWYYKTWFARTASRAGTLESIPVLIEALTGTDEKLGEEAYRALVMITGIDREQKFRKNFNDIRLLTRFGQYYRSRVPAPSR
ncbi:MAG: hypothetical protein JXA20_02010 [Spirochaetes bacterium]|nr:hypothetical protein [Spirochaetota bacterium]